MVNRFLLCASVLVLAACDTNKYTRPIQMTPHGTAVRANMAAQIIDPTPPAQRPIVVDASRPTKALEAYRKDEVKEPSREDAAASTAAVNQ